MEATLVRMNTWDDVCTYLATTCEIRRTDGETAELVVPMTPEHAQTLRLRCSTVREIQWLEVTGMIGHTRFASPQGMLAGNAELAIGSLALNRDGSVVLRQTMPLRGLRAFDLEELIHDMAAQTARATENLRKRDVSSPGS